MNELYYIIYIIVYYSILQYSIFGDRMSQISVACCFGTVVCLFGTQK